MGISSSPGSARQEDDSRSTDLEARQQRFLESVSHSLRTPLTAVLGFAESLRSDTGGLDEQQRSELVATIADQAAVMSQIVEDYLVGAQAEMGGLSVARVPIDLRAQLAQVIERTHAHTPLEPQIQGESAALGDPGQVRQILRNLLLDAELDCGTNILVRLSEHHDSALLTVMHNGPGALIADPDSEDKSPGSLGVGLSVARQLAQLMGGELTHRHERGHTTYTLSLPALRPDGEADPG